MKYNKLFLSTLAASSLMFATQASAESTELEDLKKRVEALEKLNISGSFRMNYRLRDDNDSEKDRGGDSSFNLFNLKVDTESNGIRLSADYRWYDGLETVHHSYIATDVDENSEIQLGITKVPFGIFPYESNSWWFGIAYYLGLTDDYDTGIKYITQNGKWNIQAAYFGGTEYQDNRTARYSYDVISSTDGSSKNEEDGTLVTRVAYSFDSSGELGLSARVGQIYNTTEEKHGSQWAASLHHIGKYGGFTTQTQVTRYEYDLENPEGTDSDVVHLGGGVGGSFNIAAKANLYTFNVSYDVPVANSRISNLRFYNDYSHMVKDGTNFEDSQLNTTGVAISAGAVYANIDVIAGRNARYISGGADSYAQGTAKKDWGTRFNINVGYYF
ncbi:hypothetical protein [Bacterioplanoides sp.]|uniref:hypothetical protein n=1 Tax=Bacterioplanoides sp. TaxID=2066072 RepID=UPI003B5A38FE